MPLQLLLIGSILTLLLLCCDESRDGVESSRKEKVWAKSCLHNICLIFHGSGPSRRLSPSHLLLLLLPTWELDFKSFDPYLPQISVLKIFLLLLCYYRTLLERREITAMLC